MASGRAASGERSLTPGLSDVQEGEVVHRKLEGAAERYNSLLRSQLEEQRAFYEQKLNDLKKEFSVPSNNASSSTPKKAEDLLSVLKQERKQVNHRLKSLELRKGKVQKRASELKHMNESIEKNKILLKHQIQQAGRERNETKEMFRISLPPLLSKLAGLMKQLEESMAD